VGVGDHNLFVQGPYSKKITISDQREIKIDLQIPMAEKIVFTGNVFDGETMEPVVGAILEGVSRDFSKFDEWRATTTEDGSFENDSKSGKNIGFPSEPESLNHFSEMLKSTRQRMTDQEINRSPLDTNHRALHASLP